MHLQIIQKLLKLYIELVEKHFDILELNYCFFIILFIKFREHLENIFKMVTQFNRVEIYKIGKIVFTFFYHTHFCTILCKLAYQKNKIAKFLYKPGNSY